MFARLFFNGLLASEVLLTLPKPTILAFIHDTGIVKVGLANVALKFSAVCSAFDFGK